MMQTSSFFDLLSHPDRILARHLQGCDEVSKLALQNKVINAAFFPQTLLEVLRRIMVFYHDFGKGSDFFQLVILEVVWRESSEEFRKYHREYADFFFKTKREQIGELLRRNERLSDHAKLGAYMALTVFQHDDPLVEAILLKVIRRHHGQLTNFTTSDGRTPQIRLGSKSEVEDLELQLEHFNFESYEKILSANGLTLDRLKWPLIRDRFLHPLLESELCSRLKQADTLRYFFLQHFLFSLLLSADKGDMMIGIEDEKGQIIKPNRLLPSDLVDLYKIKKFSGKAPTFIDSLREDAYQSVVAEVNRMGENSFFSLTLPTGLGKTLVTYRVAIQLQHQVSKQTGQVPRIIYCLPFTSIIDQNAEILAEMFDHYREERGEDLNRNWMAIHHHLSAYNERYDERELTNDEAEYLTVGWEQDVIVTTFVQLLESIFTNSNRALRKFHNLTNSIVILDEVQGIPPKYFEAVEEVFKALSAYFGTKFIFVTATQPFLFSKPDEILELTDPTLVKTKYYFEQLNRIQIDQSLLKEKDYQSRDLKDWLSIFANDVESNSHKSFLFIANTIAHAQRIFFHLRERLQGTATQMIYLSSSLLPQIRLEKIQLIKSNIEKGVRQIVVSTQVVEAGVDIDLDVVYRDLAPLDSINQSAGRCNRNGIRGQGIVKLYHTGMDRFIYDATLRDITIRVLRTFPDIIEERDLYILNRAYSAEVRNSVAKDSDVSNEIIDAMKRLDVEKVSEKFRLIEEDHRSYNVFIGYSSEAQAVWKSYERCQELNGFERKREIKKLMPKIMQFITRFPKKYYQPPQDQALNFIINEPEWEVDYSLETGFKLPNNSTTSIFL